MTHNATHTPEDAMVYFDLSDEQWDALPNEVIVKLTDVYVRNAAAPAMYEALKNILALQLDCDGVPVKLTEYHCHQVREAQAALAQAEGGES